MWNGHRLFPSITVTHGSAFKTWTSYWKREGSASMDRWNAATVQLRQPSTYRLMESVGLGGPGWLGSSWQRGIAESGGFRLSTLMIETPGVLVWDLPCVQETSCLEGDPLLWILPLYLHVNKKIWWWWWWVALEDCGTPKTRIFVSKTVRSANFLGK